MTDEPQEKVGYKNPPKHSQFKKGDPRINRKGRPRTFDTLRELAQEIAHETAKGKDGKPIVVEGHALTVTEAILRQWARDPKMQEKFMAYAFGKVPDNMNLKVEDWQSEVVQLLKNGDIDPEDVRIAFPDMAQQLFAQAGITAVSVDGE